VIYITIEMRHAPFFGWIQDLSAPDPTSLFNLFGLLPYDVRPSCISASGR
jgi:YidC/Oxa1 family membrane protein insertase